MKCLWKPHVGQQTRALSIDESCFEILYGGARGGGKSDAGIIWMLKAVHDPNFVGLVIRRNHSDLRNWLDRAEQLYTSGYTDEALDNWAQRITLWSNGSQPDDAHLISSGKPPARKRRAVYCYFDNDVKVRAPYDARQLLRRLGLDKDLETTPGQLEGALA